MERFTPRTAIYLLIDLALLVICVLHIPSLQQRAAAPLVATDKLQQVIVTDVLATGAGSLLPGDSLLTWNDQRVYSWSVIEHLANYSRIGDRIPISYSRSGEQHSSYVGLVPAYNFQYILIVCLVGIITWALGVFVLLARPFDRTARVLHWCMIALGVAVVLAFEGVTPDSRLGYLSSLLFFISYMSICAGFLLFTFMFPRTKTPSFAATSMLIVIPAAALTSVVIYNHHMAYESGRAAGYFGYMSWSAAFRLFVLLYLGGGLVNFIHSYVTAGSREERKKLQWILWGLCIGAIPFTLFTVAPQALGMGELIPERFSLIILVVIPVSLAISVIKHRILDIELVINRTTVYGIVIGLLLVVYVGIVALAAAWVGSQNVGFAAFAAVLVALLFEPVRRRVQQFVDKRFFRVKYDFQIATRDFVGEIKECHDVQQLATLMVQHTDHLIPVERIGFFILKQPGNRLRTLAQKGFPLFVDRSVRFEPEKLKTPLQLPVALNDCIEPGVRHESADAEVFRRWGMEIVFTMLSEHNESLGFLVLGEKKSGARFTSEDIDLLNTAATQAGLEIERIMLQQKLFLKQAEAERLEELSSLKSDFVSYVSHELKTPLTSIKMFAELLKKRTSSRDKRSREYLDTIEGEAGRLDRMVTTILDSTRIDQGQKEYTLKDTDLREIVRKVMDTMHYQLEKHRFRVVVARGGRRLPVWADPDAVAQAVINLVANSIKYSASRKHLKVTEGASGGWIFCRVEDRGVGINSEALEHLFEKFYRDPAHSNRAEGVGLGLPLVKHIMDAHGGRIEVKSKVGQGTAVTLLFPKQAVGHGQQEENSDR
jgi:signal transduction histidine kinase